jgi:hypothetical protein
MRTFSFACTSASLGFAALLIGGYAPLSAQDGATAPAHISSVDGNATIDRNGELEPVVVNMPVVEGDRLRTANGRVSVMYPDGSAIDIDRDSEVEFLGAARVRVVAGVIEHRMASAAYDPAWAPQSVAPGLPAAAQPVSAQYLPGDLRPYSSELDQNGAWQYQPPYGYVWYPTVTPDWRPYFSGHWQSVPAYGWTWIGYDPWAWPTHHYGRWGFAHSRWFWVPGRTFAAAWVTWGTAPGYVSWCPLGFDGRPVAALSVGYRAAWNAWTFVPRDRFGWRGYPVPRYAIEPHRIASTTRFAVHREAPPARAFAATSRQPPAASRPLAAPSHMSAITRYVPPGRPSSGDWAGARPVAPRFAPQPQPQPRYRASPGSSDYRPAVGHVRSTLSPATPALTRPSAPAYTRETPNAFSRQRVSTSRSMSPPRAPSPPRAMSYPRGGSGQRPSPHVERGPSRSSTGRAAVKRRR